MKPRFLTLYLSLVTLVLIAAAIVTGFALTASDAKKAPSIPPKNNLIFNWGSSS
jgi:hypothetical protein